MDTCIVGIMLTVFVIDADGSNSRADGESSERGASGETDSEALFLLVQTVWEYGDTLTVYGVAVVKSIWSVAVRVVIALCWIAVEKESSTPFSKVIYIGKKVSMLLWVGKNQSLPIASPCTVLICMLMYLLAVLPDRTA